MILNKDFLQTTGSIRSAGNDLLRAVHSQGKFSGGGGYGYICQLSQIVECIQHCYSRQLQIRLATCQLTTVWMINRQYR